MKECRECNYFNGYNYDDGTPICDYDGGYENCPYWEPFQGVCCNGDSEYCGDFVDDGCAEWKELGENAVR